MFTSLFISKSALGSVWDSLGIGFVGNEYFRSWDSSHSLLWTPAKPAQPSLSARSASTTVAAAMFVDGRWSASSVLRAVKQLETGSASGPYPCKAPHSAAGISHSLPLLSIKWTREICAVLPTQRDSPDLFRVGVYTVDRLKTNDSN